MILKFTVHFILALFGIITVYVYRYSDKGKTKYVSDGFC